MSVNEGAHKSLTAVKVIADRDLSLGGDKSLKVSHVDAGAKAPPEPVLTWKKLANLSEAGPFKERGCVNAAAMLDEWKSKLACAKSRESAKTL